MHGLINRSIESFVRSCYGTTRWREVAADVGLTEDGFQSFRHYSDEITSKLIASVARRLGKPRAELLEDLGAWLARHEAIRRLLRFSGSDYSDFVISLEELPGRAQMVIPDLEVPRLHVQVCGAQQFRIRIVEGGVLWQALIAGLLRAMSDDYGALTLIIDEKNSIYVDVSDASFGEAKGFDISGHAAFGGA